MKMLQARKHGGTQSSVNRIVIHATVSPCVRGGAEAVARYFQSAGAGGSAHYVVDPGEIVSCLKESTVAYHAPPNTGSIGVELCDPQKGPDSRWDDGDHQEMLRLAAGLVRRVAARWDVPLKRLSVADLKAGRHGICGHVDVSRAFRMSDHTDPGSAFPWEAFMALVCGQEEPPPAPKPQPNPTEVMVKKLPTLRQGDKGWDVKTMHYLLLARDYAGLEGVDDMTFTPAHTAGIKGLQQAAGIEVDGICGINTWSVLLRVA